MYRYMCEVGGIQGLFAHQGSPCYWSDSDSETGMSQIQSECHLPAKKSHLFPGAPPACSPNVAGFGPQLNQPQHLIPKCLHRTAILQLTVLGSTRCSLLVQQQCVCAATGTEPSTEAALADGSAAGGADAARSLGVREKGRKGQV